MGPADVSIGRAPTIILEGEGLLRGGAAAYNDNLMGREPPLNQYANGPRFPRRTRRDDRRL